MGIKVQFTKMQGAGNDFIVINTITQVIHFTENTLRRLAHRGVGVGCDQILLVEPPLLPDADFFMRIYNANGKPAGQCLNGARCFARFVLEEGLTNKTQLRLQTTDTIVHAEVTDFNNITVQVENPRRFNTIAYTHNNQSYTIFKRDLGNPHAIIKVEDLMATPLKELGAGLQNHPEFPEGVNVTLIQVLSRTQIKVRTFERGVGLTHACGSGALAAAIVGIEEGWLDPSVTISLPFGQLVATLDKEGHATLSGPAAWVYEGHFWLQREHA